LCIIRVPWQVLLSERTWIDHWSRAERTPSTSILSHWHLLSYCPIIPGHHMRVIIISNLIGGCSNRPKSCPASFRDRLLRTPIQPRCLRRMLPFWALTLPVTLPTGGTSCGEMWPGVVDLSLTSSEARLRRAIRLSLRRPVLFALNNTDFRSMLYSSE